MTSPVWWLVEVTVEHEGVAAFMRHTDKMVAAACREPGTVAYQRFRDDATTFHLYERYATPNAAELHLRRFTDHFAAAFEPLITRRRFHVYDPLTPTLQHTLDLVGAKTLDVIAGFDRDD
jgi:quinol monooxygenase YgiN